MMGLKYTKLKMFPGNNIILLEMYNYINLLANDLLC